MEREQIDYPVIDAHVHLYPDALAPKVTPALGAKFGNPPSFDGTVAGCRAADARSGIAASLNLPVATAAHQVAHANDFWSAHVPDAEAERLSGRPAVFSLASLHPGFEDKPAELERVKSLGFTGVKFHPEYQLFRFNDPAMDDTWAAMSELGLVAYLHAGGERVFSPPFHSTPGEIRDLHRRFPSLRIVAAHLGGFRMWDEAEEVLAGQDVYLDLSHTFFWMDDGQILRIVRKHGARRILFGTDAPWQDPGEVLGACLDMPLSCAEFRAILHDNACALFGIGVQRGKKIETPCCAEA